MFCTLGLWILSPKYPKSQGPRGRGPEVLGILGPRPSGPWDLKYLGLKVRGPKVRGPRAQGLMALESKNHVIRHKSSELKVTVVS